MPTANDNEAASNLNASMKNLDMAVQGIYDARKRGDIEDMRFYYSVIERFTKSVRQWAGELKPKTKDNNADGQ